MSLEDKINKKRAEKEQNKLKNDQDSIVKQKQTIEEEKSKIISLKNTLEQYYSNTLDDVEKYKTKRGEVKNNKDKLDVLYKDNEDIMKEDDLNNVEEMIMANLDEEEIIEYNEGKNKQKDLSQSVRGGVESIGIIKQTLKEELPDLDLKFSGGKKGEEKSDREISLEKIDTYLGSLDKKIKGLGDKEKELYLETNEGKKEACKKELDLDSLFDSINIDKIDNFKIPHNILELENKYGEELVKEVLNDSLDSKLEKIVWENKGKNVQEGINNAENFKKISETMNMDLSQEFEDTKNLEKEALEHLKKIFSDNKDINDRLTRYFRNDDPQRQAEVYLNDFIGFSSLSNGNLQNFEKYYLSYKQNIIDENFQDNSGLSKDFFVDSLKEYKKAFQYIINNANQDTKFVGNSIEDKDSFIDSLNLSDGKGIKNRKKEGIKNTIIENYQIKIPLDYIHKFRSYDEAVSDAYRENNNWKKEQANIEEISKKVVEFRYIQTKEEEYKAENSDVIISLRKAEEDLAEIKDLNYKVSSLPIENKDRKIIIKKEGYIIDQTAEDERKEYKKELKKLKKERDEYIQNLIDADQLLVDGIGNNIFSNKKKKNRLTQRISILKQFSYEDFIDSNSVKNSEEFLDTEEKQKINDFYQTGRELELEYKQKKSKGDDLEKLISNSSRLNIDDERGLYGNEMTIRDFLEVSSALIKTKLEYFNNLPPKEKEIVNNIDKNEQERRRIEEDYRNNKFKYKL